MADFFAYSHQLQVVAATDCSHTWAPNTLNFCPTTFNHKAVAATYLQTILAILELTAITLIHTGEG